MFDLKTQPWHIFVNSPEECQAAQEWLFSQGLTWCNGDVEVSNLYARTLSNYFVIFGERNFTLDIRGFVYDVHKNDYEDSSKELKLEFANKFVVNSYKTPVIETVQQKQIRELEETIAKAQEQIQSLKEGK